jgi:KaiC/GvpD/RAD55 family RecA-like ATPase
MAAKAAGLSFDDFNDWSTSAGNYGGEAETRAVWNSFKPGRGVNAGTLFHMAREAGWKSAANDNRPALVAPSKPKHDPQKIWDACEPATDAHPYIERKGGSADGLRVNRHGALVVPARDASGTLRTLQFIPPEAGAKKLNLTGCHFDGGYHVVGTLERGAKAYVCEGIGQAWAAHQATGTAAVVAFGDSNMARVAAALRDAGMVPVLVPDGGKQAKTEERARAIGCAMVDLPADFAANYDINDLRKDESAEAVRAVLERERVPQPDDAPANDDAPAMISHFAFLNVGDMVGNLKPIDWLVKGYVERDSMAVIFGEPGHGKSFVAIDVACSVATGAEWHGRTVKQGAVFYIAGEGHNGLARRFAAWSKARGVSLSDAPLYVSNRSASLTDGMSAAQVAEAVQQLADATGATPSLIVVDTLARNFGAGDENSAADMGRFVANLDNALRHPWKATVAIVHHSGKDTSKGARGSTALRGAVDAEYEIARDDTGLIRMQPHKMKDAENPEPLAFRLQGIELPLLDEDGNRVFGAAIRSSEYVEPPKPGKTGRGKNQSTALQVLKQMEAEHRKRLEDAGNDPAAALVKEDDWKHTLRAEPYNMNRFQFRDAKDGLISAGSVVIVPGGYVRAA